MSQVLAAGSRSTTGRGLNITLWVLQIAAALLFLMAGAGKLMGGAEMVSAFGAIGFGQWFRYFTGCLEIVSALLLLYPGFAAFGAALLVPTMIGAILTHLTVMHTSPAMPAIILLIVCVILWGRWEQIAARIGR